MPSPLRATVIRSGIGRIAVADAVLLPPLSLLPCSRYRADCVPVFLAVVVVAAVVATNVVIRVAVVVAGRRCCSCSVVCFGSQPWQHTRPPTREQLE